MSESSIFTKIINRELPAKILYEDEEFISFSDINPKAPVHVLLVTKQPYTTLEELAIDDVMLHGRLLTTARRVAQRLGIDDNYKLFMNVGLDVQVVHHIHLHIMGGWKTSKPVETPNL